MSLRSMLACGLLVLPVLAAVPGPAAAQPVPDPQGIVEPFEYGVDERHDPLDYQQDTDLIQDRDVSHNVGDFAHRPGRLSFVGTGDWYVSPVWMTFPHTVDPDVPESALPDADGGALHDQHDGLARPIDANRYTHLSLRIHVDEVPESLSLDWFACQELLNQCMGRMHLGDYVREGWNTITLRIRPDYPPGRPKAWSGTIHGIRLAGATDGMSVRYTLDWFRLHELDPDRHEAVLPEGASRVTYSNRRDPDYPTSRWADETWGRLTPRFDNDTGTHRVNVGALPPGTWYIREDGELRSVVVIDPRPRPEILDPDMAGGDDYATEVLGNPWDFENASDVAAVGNSTGVSYAGGALSARATKTAAAPRGNDPYVVLPLGPDGLDPVHYHRVTVDQAYDAPFNLDDADTATNPRPGGSHGRLIWRTPRHEAPALCRPQGFSDGREFVFFKTWNVYTYDMKNVPAAQGMRSSAEPNLGLPLQSQCGTRNFPADPHWTDRGPITYLRFDPHEAPDDYRWYLRDLRIAADDAADPTFDITWRDRSAVPGTTVTVKLDSNRSGFDGEVLVRDRPQQDGVNRVTFDATDRLPGTHWVNITSRTPDGRIGRDYATGPLQVSPRISGPDRVATAVEVSRQSFDRARTAIVASAASFPDALVAVQLADAVKGPVLLTHPDRLDGRVTDELDRLGVDRVIVAGGETAVGRGVAAALGDGRRVSRIGGATRYDTAANLARAALEERGTGRADRVLVTTGENFPDALAAGPYVGHADLPLVLARPQNPATPERLEDNAPAKHFLRDVGASRVTVLGGTAALSAPVVRDVAGSRSRSRIAGADRFDTARQLTAAAVKAGGSRGDVLIATGRNYPDALAAGPAALARGGVLVLTERDGVPAPTRAWLDGVGSWSSWRVIGGNVAVSHATVRSLRGASDL